MKRLDGKDILSQEVILRKLEIAKTQDFLRGQIDAYESIENEIYKKVNVLSNLNLVQEFKRPEATTNCRFFTGKHKKHRFSEITDELLKAIRKITQDNKSISDQEKIYQHYKTGDYTTDDIDILQFLKTEKISSLNEVLVTVAFLVKDDYQNGESSIYSKITIDQQQNLNVGYCVLEDENGENHVHVIFIERFCSEDGSVHFHLHCTKIVRKYKKNRHLIHKK